MFFTNMSELQINPPNVDDEYLECLNQAYGNWGDKQQFNWYFRRQTIFPAADLFVIREDGKLAAGSGITYCRLQLQDEAEMSAGIITGAWTLPQYCGRGFYYRLIEESQRYAASRNVEVLFGYVTADNPGFRQLQSLGAIPFPSFYIFSTESTPIPKTDSTLERIEPSEKIVAEMFERFAESGKGFARFTYPSARDFSAQFLERPHETEILSNRNGDFAVIEKKAETNLLQLYLPRDKNNLIDLVAYTLRQNRKFFTFTMQEEVASLAKNLGLGIKGGFLTVFLTDTSTCLPAELRWKIQTGDRA